MRHNTRFNPTANGPLHLGHVYALLVNERYAHNSGGKFYVRFDDTSPTAAALSKERVGHIIAGQREDIEWLSILVDGWSTQSKIMTKVYEEFNKHHYTPLPEYPESIRRPYFVRMGNGWIPIHYIPTETAERVIMDNMLGITDLIRGEEFSTELSLYSYLCQKFQLPTPQFIFLPRLMGKFGEISKTNGGYTIAELRASGYEPLDILSMIEAACLVVPNNRWSLENLKPSPRINL